MGVPTLKEPLLPSSKEKTPKARLLKFASQSSSDLVKWRHDGDSDPLQIPQSYKLELIEGVKALMKLGAPAALSKAWGK